MNWLYIHKKYDSQIIIMINMDRIQFISFEYNNTNLEKIIIDDGSDQYKIGSEYDQAKILKQLGF